MQTATSAGLTYRGASVLLSIVLGACVPSRPPIVEAARRGDQEEVERLLRSGADANVCAAPEGALKLSPLIAAVGSGRTDTVITLLRAGAQVDQPCGHDRPMDVAVGTDDVAMVKLLLEHGADVSARTGGGWTYLMQAAIGVNPNVIPVLISAGCPLEARRPEVPEAIDDRAGVTALMIAAGWDPRPTRALIEGGADVNARDALGATPLIHAVKGAAWTATNGPTKPGTWDPSIIEMLLEAGADPTATDASGTTPLSLTRDTGVHANTIRTMLERALTGRSVV